SGYIREIYVQEGDNVSKGSPILKIDDSDYVQTVNATKAAYDNALLEVRKLEPLVAKDIISPFQLETAKSNVQAAEAAYENAKINLGYTLITSPVSGVIGRISLREGSLLTAGITTPITSLASTGDVFAYFSFDEKQLLQLADTASKRSSLRQLVDKLPRVELVLANGELYDHQGKIELGSSLIDPATGSLQMKGIFPNPDAMLHSGSTGSLRMPAFYKNAIIIPQKATYDIQDKKMIFTVDADQVVHATNINVLNNTSDSFIIESGLNEGDKIVLDGVGKIRDGDKILIND
ncbi:MAG: efflux RND transporter periplasmic adaptor subunit, partial [Tannerella sp.]|nr:efflux RND transporter periplasmic adaptor subunit [Tannerella sp.]